MATITESVTEHVKAMEPGQLFRLSDLPAADGTASVVMHRLLKRGDPPVERLAPGFFLRREDPGEQRVWLNGDEMALYRSGPGGGFADYTAVNMVGWTTQVPWRAQVCVLGSRRLTPFDRRSVVYCNRSNPARAELTWAEVTMLEAVRRFDLAEVSWRAALRKAENEICLGRLAAVAPRPVIRSEALRIVGHAERNKAKAFHERIDDLCDQLPEVQDWESCLWRTDIDAAAQRSQAAADRVEQEIADAA